MRRRATKERILEAALNLFAEKGYDAVGIDEIAAAVGIKGPSIYRHFKSKSDIYNALMEKADSYFDDRMKRAEEGEPEPGSFSELEELTLRQVDLTLEDDKAVRVRRLLTKEQFRSAKASLLATKHFQTGVEKKYAAIFRGMMNRGILRRDDPELLAMEFVSPITMLIHLCDREPGKRHEIMAKIKAHMKHFENTYGG